MYQFFVFNELLSAGLLKCLVGYLKKTYHQISKVRCALLCHKIVDLSDVVGESPASAAPITSSVSTWFQ